MKRLRASEEVRLELTYLLSLGPRRPGAAKTSTDVLVSIPTKKKKRDERASMDSSAVKNKEKDFCNSNSL